MAAGLREMTPMALYVGNKNIENNILNNISPKNKATSAIFYLQCTTRYKPRAKYREKNSPKETRSYYINTKFSAL